MTRIKANRLLGVFIGGLLLLGTPRFFLGQESVRLNDGDTLSLQVCFSPKGGCAEAIVDAIGQAKRSVLVQAYSFTSYPIAQALIDAEKRGVKVEALVDKERIHEKGAKIGLIAKGGVVTYLDGKHAIAHNKVMIIDGKTVITGSFNFTAAAEKNNAENLLIIQDEKLAAEYSVNWNNHRVHSEEFRV